MCVCGSDLEMTSLRHTRLAAAAALAPIPPQHLIVKVFLLPLLLFVVPQRAQVVATASWRRRR